MRRLLSGILVSILLIVVIISLLTPATYAASFTPTIAANKQTVEEGREFMVKVKVSNIDAGNGINMLNGTLSYDTTVLDVITESSVEGLSSWSVKYENNVIKATKLAFINQDEDVFQITFKTKPGTTGRKADIKLTGIYAGNSEDSNIRAADISTSITVGSETPSTSSLNTIVIPTAVPTTAPTATPTATINTLNITNTNTNTNTTGTTNKVNNTNSSSNRNISYAGVEDGVVTLGFGILIIAVLAFWRIHSLKDIK